MKVSLSAFGATEIVVFVIVAAVIILLFFFAALSFSGIYQRKGLREGKKVKSFPAILETVKPQRKEKTQTQDMQETVAVIAAAIAVCTQDNPRGRFRVVSFRRTK